MANTNSASGFSVERTHVLQTRLSRRIIFEDRISQKIQFVAGVDVAYSNDTSIAAVAVLDFEALRLIESRIAVCKAPFPYIPTLLSLREVNPALMSIKKLCVQPDVFLVDGHGYAHPYRCGFASYLGLMMDRPSIGVAKEILVGEVDSGKVKGDVAFLRHKGEVVGAQISSQPDRKPIYVSVGHMISLSTATRIVKRCIFHNRIPEPIRQAHKIATAEKRKINMPTQPRTSNK